MRVSLRGCMQRRFAETEEISSRSGFRSASSRRPPAGAAPPEATTQASRRGELQELSTVGDNRPGERGASDNCYACGSPPKLPTLITLVDALSRLNVSDLKPLVAWLPEVPPSARKDDLIGTIMRGLSPSGLRLLWAGLDELQLLAVGEALYSVQGVFDPDLFRAKHGRLPEFSTGPRANGRSGSPTRLALFLFAHDRGQCVPMDLRPALTAFVPQPEPARLASVDVLPPAIGETTLSVRHTERDALVDLAVMLRLAEQGRMQVGDKTSSPTASTIRLLAGK